jgi:hypothetical protein
MKTTQTWVEILKEKEPQISREDLMFLILHETGMYWAEQTSEMQKAETIIGLYQDKDYLEKNKEFYKKMGKL